MLWNVSFLTDLVASSDVDSACLRYFQSLDCLKLCVHASRPNTDVDGLVLTLFSFLSVAQYFRLCDAKVMFCAVAMIDTSLFILFRCRGVFCAVVGTDTESRARAYSEE